MSPAPQWALACCLLAVASTSAQTGAGSSEPPALVTDRPDQTESAVTVPPGYVQIETGWLFSRDDSSGARLQGHALPGTLVRIGLTPWAELRAGWSGYVRDELRVAARRELDHGAGDAELGAKFLFWPERGARPQAALVVGVGLPVGHDGVSSHRPDPVFRLTLAHTLSDRFSLGYNAGMVWESAADDTGNRATLSRYLYTLSLGAGLSSRTGLFVELFGDISASNPGPPAHSFDTGITVLVRPHLQLDVSAGVGLSAAAPDWFVGAGVSLRLPQ